MIRVVSWNAMWAPSSKSRGQRIRDEFTRIDPDVIVLTEGTAGLLPSRGAVCEASPDWGYRVDDPTRRKVLVWSRNPWIDSDEVGHSSLPTGRWIAATTLTSDGPIRVVGVCIPWRDAHVSTGRRDRKRWEEHLEYLNGLDSSLAADRDIPCIVAGDFNQRIPRQRQPIRVADALERALSSFDIVTAGEIDGRRLIDHVAVRGLRIVGTPVVIDRFVEGNEVTDHDGVMVDLAAAPPALASEHSSV